MLKYIGRDGAFLVGVPTRDLDEDEIPVFECSVEELVASGLYQRVRERPHSNPLPEGEGEAHD